MKTVDDANDLIGFGQKGESMRWRQRPAEKVKIVHSQRLVGKVWNEAGKQKFCQMQNQIKMEFINISINRFTSKLIAPVNASNGLHSARTSDAVMS